MHSKTIISYVLTAVIAAGIGFGGGTIYQKNQASAGSRIGGSFDPQTMMNMPAGDRQGLRGGQADGLTKMRGGAGMSAGTIKERTDTTLTVTLGTDGSQLVIVTDKTAISKPAEISLSELKAGDNVFVSGQTNSDGSLTADSIQVRMDGEGFGGGPGMVRPPTGEVPVR
ncbi:hypothetical protein JW899_05100 [Candidatus Uhrbacteria bacterium]|nr:hypothetical protein [Candidatus Uhrbacteria bacterium]